MKEGVNHKIKIETINLYFEMNADKKYNKRIGKIYRQVTWQYR